MADLIKQIELITKIPVDAHIAKELTSMCNSVFFVMFGCVCVCMCCL